MTPSFMWMYVCMCVCAKGRERGQTFQPTRTFNIAYISTSPSQRMTLAVRTVGMNRDLIREPVEQT